MNKNHLLHGVYAITNHSHQSDKKLFNDVEQVLSNGVTVLQYRDKSLDTKKRHRQCSQLKKLCYQYQSLFIVNDDVNLTKACEADGVHLGQTDTSLNHARSILGEHSIIGISCYDQIALVDTAVEGGADYIAIGRFFPSTTKPHARQANKQLLHLIQQKHSLPIVAIGGITPDNATELIEAGSKMIAVIDAIFGQKNIALATQQLTQLFKQEKL